MKTASLLTCFATLACATLFAKAAEEAPRLSLRPSNAGFDLWWPGTVKGADGSMLRPYFELQRSFDLQTWQPFGERQRAAATTPEQSLNARLALDQPQAFYRLLSIQPTGAAKLASEGAQVFGYADAFAQELQRAGQISVAQFAAMFPNAASYLPGISWDPTTAQFWSQFNTDPVLVNQGKDETDPGYRTFDFRLSEAEQAVFKKNGFMVSERLGSGSFADVFYNVWHNDLPVFVSTDAILQAWHRTYDAMLEEMEETYLFNSVQAMLDGMAAQVNAAASEVGNGVLKESLFDADYFLTVARTLLAGTNGPPVTSALAQDARVAETLADVRAEQLKEVPDFMGFCRIVDFSQFKVRGHYTHTERLGRYFQCVMWLGRIDVPVAGGPWIRCPNVLRFASPRELGVAISLWHLLNASGQFDLWRDMERTISVFVGITDSLTFGQLGGLLAGASIRTLADVRDLAMLERLQADIVRGELGVQNIRSDWFQQPFKGGERYALPQTFTVFGQKFVPDSWAFSQTVFSNVLWVENGETNKVQRRVPGALDVAFSVMGNNQVVPELIAQMRGSFDDSGRPHALKFRDGFPYQHNLAAVRAVMDRQTPVAWESNVYLNWLATLRELSAPTTDTRYPEAMRTRAWAMKTLNTQLASWTHLRHDTILYAKQSYTDGEGCLYPTGFVEPRLEFWMQLGQMAAHAAEQIASLKYAGTYNVVSNWPAVLNSSGEIIQENGRFEGPIPLSGIQDRQVSHLRDFAAVIGRLERLARKELAGECFSTDEEKFIDALMEERGSAGCGGPLTYSGWYPRLFYRTVYWFENLGLFHPNYGAGASDALVADVHTDVPNIQPPDPGGVVHEAVGPVNLLMLAVDNGVDRFICAGPVLSHYEFEVIGEPRRISDGEWGGGNSFRERPRGMLDGRLPLDVPRLAIEGLQPPPWTRSYLVPR